MAQDFGTPEGTPPLEGTPKKTNTTLIIIIVVVAVLLCCCCLVIVLGYTFGDEILRGLGISKQIISSGISPI